MFTHSVSKKNLLLTVAGLFLLTIVVQAKKIHNNEDDRSREGAPASGTTYWITNQDFFTMFLAGSPRASSTRQYFNDQLTSWSLPPPNGGITLASPFCTLYHGSLTIPSGAVDLDASAFTVTPDVDAAGKPILSVDISSISISVHLAQFSVSCRMPQAFKGVGGTVEVSQVGYGSPNAAFTWTGALKWHVPLKLVTNSFADRGVQIAAPPKLVTQLLLNASYAYGNTSHSGQGQFGKFLFDPFVKHWFNERAGTLSTELHAELEKVGQKRFNQTIGAALYAVNNQDTTTLTCKMKVDATTHELIIKQQECSKPIDPPAAPAAAGPCMLRIFDMFVTAQPKKLIDGSALSSAQSLPTKPGWTVQVTEFETPTDSFYAFSYNVTSVVFTGGH